MSSETGGTAWYEVASKITPLVLGIFITGGGIWATNRVQEGQLQLSQINSLFAFLPKMRSADAAECVSAFEAFNGDGLELLVVNIIDRTKEPCGRPRLRAIANTANEARLQARDALRTLPVQVFMHIDSEAQAVAANRFAQQVDAYGAQSGATETFSYRGVTVVGQNAPAQPEIRYFVDSDREDAEALAAIYRQAVAGAEPVVQLKTMMAKPGTLEVWMPHATVSAESRTPHIASGKDEVGGSVLQTSKALRPPSLAGEELGRVAAYRRS